MSKSKSKTFPKGTDPLTIHHWIDDKITYTPAPAIQYPVTKDKYLITLTKIEDEKDGQ